MTASADEVYGIGASGDCGVGVAEVSGRSGCLTAMAGISSKVSGSPGGHARGLW